VLDDLHKAVKMLQKYRKYTLVYNCPAAYIILLVSSLFCCQPSNLYNEKMRSSNAWETGAISKSSAISASSEQDACRLLEKVIALFSGVFRNTERGPQGSAGRSSLMGSRGKAPEGGLGDFVPQKLEHCKRNKS
jgi:hypothetical protein